MKSRRLAIGAALASLAVLYGLLLYMPSWWTATVFAVWSTALMGGGWYGMRRHYEDELSRQERRLQKTAITTLNHHRHDWMNELQVLYGYLQLGKADKSVACVERIKERIALDSRISRLGIPSLVFFLQSYRTFGSGLQLDIQVEEGTELEGRLSAEAGEELTALVIRLIRSCSVGLGALSGEERCLTLRFALTGNFLLFGLEGDGMRRTPEEVRLQVGSILEGNKIKAEQQDSGNASARLRLPLQM